jgi:hypothetical protein
MTLPKGDEKTYLEIAPTEGGFTIQAEEQHAVELLALFQQHGITCELHPEVSPGKDELAFTLEVRPSQVREILDTYKTSKGS